MKKTIREEVEEILGVDTTGRKIGEAVAVKFVTIRNFRIETLNKPNQVESEIRFVKSQLEEQMDNVVFKLKRLQERKEEEKNNKFKS